MLHFFRRVRLLLLGQASTDTVHKSLLDPGQARKPDSPLGRYFLYAIGEIALVVIGILIALQINNWNEERKEYNQIKSYAVSLIQDLNKDIEMIQIIDYTMKQIIIRIDSLGEYIYSKEIDEISNLHLLAFTWLQYRPYSWNRATIEALKNSGSIRLIKNRDLQTQIVKYDAFTRHMDEDLNTDKAQSEDAHRLLNKSVNNNYPNKEELTELFRISTISGTLKDVFMDPIFKEAERYNLPLIKKDLPTIQEAINSYNRLRFNLDIRTRIELPELIEDAEKLIQVLQKEYGI